MLPYNQGNTIGVQSLTHEQETHMNKKLSINKETILSLDQLMDVAGGDRVGKPPTSTLDTACICHKDSIACETMWQTCEGINTIQNCGM